MSKINCLNDLCKFIACDLRSSSKELSFRRILTDPVLRFTLALRFNEYLYNKQINIAFRFFPLMYFRQLSVRLGFSIPFNVFREGLAIVHYGTLVINPAVKIGRNCRIHVGVNIGGAGGLVSSQAALQLSPKIGDNVYIGPGAKIYGPIMLANNCVVGANAVVGRSFKKEGVTVAGSPAKMISQKGSAGMLKKGCEDAG